LVRADLTVNKNMVPFDTQSPFVTSGIRIGTAAITTRGFKEADCSRTVKLIDNIISNISDEEAIIETKKEINKWMADFPLYEKGVTA